MTKVTAKKLNVAPYANLGASNHSKVDRSLDDYYATDSKCVKDLMKREQLTKHILEPSVGAGHIANCLMQGDIK